MIDLKDVKHWHYQLQGDINRGTIESSNVGLIVIDIDEDPAPLLNGERHVAAYLSIGEAEEYRAYWFKLNRKRLIIGANPDWPGNYAVRFWLPEWQELMVARAKEAAAKGFTALYLDKVDVIYDIENKWPRDGNRFNLSPEMLQLIGAIKAAVPKMKIIMQNAEQLLIDQAELTNVIDAIGKEDLWYGAQLTGQPNPKDDVEWTIQVLQTSGKPVFCIEYLEDPNIINEVLDAATLVGWPITIDDEDRALDG